MIFLFFSFSFTLNLPYHSKKTSFDISDYRGVGINTFVWVLICSKNSFIARSIDRLVTKNSLFISSLSCFISCLFFYSSLKNTFFFFFFGWSFFFFYYFSYFYINFFKKKNLKKKN